MANEIGQLRQWAQAQQAQQAQQQMPSGDDFDEWVERNPHQAALQALQVAQQTGDFTVYDRTIESWAETNWMAASRFDNDVRMTRAMGQLIQDIQPAIQPLLQRSESQEQAAALLSVQQRHGDFSEYEEAMVNAAYQVPHLLEPLRGGTREQKEAALTALYHLARSQSMGGAQPPQGGIPPQAAAQAANKIGSSVQMPSSVPGGQPQPVHPNQGIYDLFDQAAGFNR
jgi:hypothetical protein